MTISADKQWLLLENSARFRAPREGDFHTPATSEDAGQCGLKHAREPPGGPAASTFGTGSMSASSTAGKPGADVENLTLNE